MKPQFEKLIDTPGAGFAFRVVRGNSFAWNWHSHAEFELILIVESGGYRMVGDHLAPLRPGDLVLLGPNLSHIYQNDETGPGCPPAVHALLVQFRSDFLGDQWLQSPSLKPVRRLLKRAGLGLCFARATSRKVAPMMQAMAKLEGLRQIIQVLKILDTLAASPDSHPLAGPGFTAEGNRFDQERLNCVLQILNQRLDQPIRLNDLARAAHLSAGAFSRFFRQHTERTLPQFVNELRVGRSCRLLAESEMDITKIAFACGFGNLSNFNRQFRRLKGITPSAFRDQVETYAIGHQTEPD